MSGDASGLNAITSAEHIGPVATGDNIEAKRAADYAYDNNAGTWGRVLQSFLNTTYDSVYFTNPDANGNYQTITFKYSGSIVRTLTLTFDASNNVTSIVKS